jgi:molybdopterin-guanine dinucleotide biosynthesis adapter protein
MRNKKKPILIAVSGVKNSGKTTLIIKLIPKLISLGYKVATIKHDGHDFKSDIEGTDSYKHKEAGAYGSAIFSKTKLMVVKEQKQTCEKELINYFPEADIILLEGFKNSSYPKIEVVRSKVSEHCICPKETLIAVATDLKDKFQDIKAIDINDIDEITKVLLKSCMGEKND